MGNIESSSCCGAAHSKCETRCEPNDQRPWLNPEHPTGMPDRMKQSPVATRLQRGVSNPSDAISPVTSPAVEALRLKALSTRVGSTARRCAPEDATPPNGPSPSADRVTTVHRYHSVRASELSYLPPHQSLHRQIGVTSHSSPRLTSTKNSLLTSQYLTPRGKKHTTAESPTDPQNPRSYDEICSHGEDSSRLTADTNSQTPFTPRRLAWGQSLLERKFLIPQSISMEEL